MDLIPTMEFGFVCYRHNCVFRRAATRMASEMLALMPVTRCDIWLEIVDGRSAKDLAPISSTVTNLGGPSHFAMRLGHIQAMEHDEPSLSIFRTFQTHNYL